MLPAEPKEEAGKVTGTASACGLCLFLVFATGWSLCVSFCIICMAMSSSSLIFFFSDA